MGKEGKKKTLLIPELLEDTKVQAGCYADTL